MRTRSRTVALLLFDEVELLDFAGPLEVLSVAGRHYNFRPFKIVNVACTPGLIETRNQMRIQADTALADCTAADVLLVPGGYGARRALGEPRIEAFLHERGEACELVLAVGFGCLLVAQAGLCRGQTVSAPQEIAELCRELDPSLQLSPDAIACSGRLLTASKSAQSTELGLRAVSQLLGAKLASQVGSRLGIAAASDAGTTHIRLEPPSE